MGNSEQVAGVVAGGTVAEEIVKALYAGRAMRTQQKEYFATRQQAALNAARVAERFFDDALADALWWIRYHEKRPVQGELFA